MAALAPADGGRYTCPTIPLGFDDGSDGGEERIV